MTKRAITADPPTNFPPDFALVRWNLGALMVDVTFFSLALAFLDPVAVMPLLLRHLGASGPLIGLHAALTSLAFTLPQLLVAYRTHGSPRQKPLLARAAIITRVPMLIVPVALARAADSNVARITALVAFILLVAFWSLGDGTGYVPWMEIIARSFGGRTRGRFFGISQLVSGVLSIVVGSVVVRTVLATFRFPTGYVVLAGMSAACVLISLGGVVALREPPPSPVSAAPKPPLVDYVRRLPRIARENPIFLRLAVIQLLIGFGTASSRFYVLYATRRFGLHDEWGGVYQGMSAIGVVTLMPLLTYVSERYGAASGVRLVALVSLLTPLTALTLGTLSPWLFGLVFLFMGGSLGWGIWIAVNHFLLSHVTDDERPIFVALINLMVAPAALFPILGGLLTHDGQLLTLGGVPILFGVTASVIAVGFACALTLPQPEEPYVTTR